MTRDPQHSSKAEQEASEPAYVWCDEDGDTWYAEGHHLREVMMEGVIRCESDNGSTPPSRADFVDATITHRWYLQDPKDEELGKWVPEGTPGAEPMTEIYGLEDFR